MAKIKQGILGGFSGKVGNITGSSWKGIAVVKSRPLSVAYPGTGAQVTQTNAMTSIVAFAKMILSTWIKPLWDRFAVQMSGYNAFTSANIQFYPNGVLTDFADLIMSKGKMLAVPIASITYSLGSHSISITWDPGFADPLALDTDISYLSAYNENQNTFVGGTDAPRADGASGIVFPAGSQVDDTIHFWFAFKALNGTRVSGSTYATGTIVA